MKKANGKKRAILWLMMVMVIAAQVKLSVYAAGETPLTPESIQWTAAAQTERAVAETGRTAAELAFAITASDKAENELDQNQLQLWRVMADIAENTGKMAALTYNQAKPPKPYSHQSGETAGTKLGNGTSVTMTNQLETRADITVTKVWDDAKNQDGIRPASVKIQLVKDSGESHSETKTVTLNQANNWSYTFTNLLKYQPDGEKACIYTVREVIDDAAANRAYTKLYSLDGAAYVVGEPTITEALNSPDTITRTVHVKNSYVPVSMNIKVSTLWDDAVNKYSTRPNSIKILLKSTTNQDGVTGATAVTGIANNPMTISAPALATGSWEGSFNSLPIRKNAAGSASAPGSSELIYYSVVEVMADGTEAPVPLAQYLSPTYGYTAAGTGEVKMGAGGAEVAISGKITDASGLDYQVAVTNTLNTVEQVIELQWDDYANLFHSRPTSMVFTLQQRVFGSGAAYVNAEDAQGTLIQKTIACELSTATTQQTSFIGLPKYNAAGVAYEYRVLETNFWYGGILEQTVSDSADVTNGRFETHGYKHSYASATVPISKGYQTTVINTLELERIILSGETTWVDADNKFASRPQALDLRVYYKYSASDPQWTQYTLPYTVHWDKAAGVNRWTYRIEDLIKYVAGTDDRIIYKVSEREPSFYEQTAPLGDAMGTVGLTGDITGVNFTNTLIAGAELAVSKTRDRGQAGDEFEFSVWLSDAPLTSSNPGTVFKGTYEIYAIADTAYGTVLETKTTTTGTIRIKADQVFVIKDLPLDYCYLVEETQSDDYTLTTKAADRSGMLGNQNGEISEVHLVNHGNAKLAISNETNSANFGGKVVVITETASVPSERGEDGYKADRLAVAWQPEPYWIFGDSFTIEYTTFEGTKGKITLSDYLDKDGRLKALSDCTVVEDTLGDLDTWIANGAGLSWTNDHQAIKLILAEDAANMPYQTKVLVAFTPTLAVNNLTAQNAGGKVKVENGQESNEADGVPAYGGNPYPGATTVYGTADTGYQVAVRGLALRNMNDVNGEPVLLNVHADGTFSVMLATTLGGDTMNIKVTGKVEFTQKDGVVRGVKIVLDELPIPLQFDIVFDKLGAPPTKNPIQTGDNAPYIGFGAMFVISGAAIIVIIRNKRKLKKQ